MIPSELKKALKESDWNMLQEWWDGWPGWTPPDKEFLPENGTGGLIVEKDGKPIVAGFIFLGINLKIAYFGWIVSDPKYRNKDRILAIEILIKKAEEFCKSVGKTYLNSFVNKRNPVLLKAHEKLGWDISKETSYELTKIL